MRFPQLAALGAAMFLSLTGTASASGDTFHVAPDAKRAQTPCTIAQPCSLSFGLGQAFDGDEVRLAGGTYHHDLPDSLDVRPGVKVLGTPGAQRPHINQSAPYRDCAGCVVIDLRFASVLRDVDVSQVEGGGAVRAVAETTIERSALRGRSTALRLGPWVQPGPAGGVIDVQAIADDGIAILASGGGTTHQLENVTAIGHGTLGVGISVRTHTGVDTTVDAVNTIARGGLYDVQAAPGGSAGWEDFATLKLRYSNFRQDKVDASPADPAWNHAQIEAWDNNQHGDPKFVSATDFRLQNGSAAIDKGRATGLFGELDLDGLPRAFNGTPDIGAYEWRPATTTPRDPEPKPDKKPDHRPDDVVIPKPPVTFTGLALGRQSTKVKRGVAAIKVTCPVAQLGPCAGTLSLKSGRTKLGSKRFSVPRGATAIVKVKLSKKGRKLIARKRKVKANAIATTVGAPGQRVQAKSKVTLKLARSRKRRR